MHRFFVSPKAINEGQVVLEGGQAHQVLEVLRLRVGSDLQVLDNAGWQYDARIVSTDGGRIAALLSGRRLVDTEPRAKITVYQGLLRPARFEFMLQKCTEIGVVGFVPTITERSVIGHVSDVSESRLERWQRVILEASEQSGRGKLPVLRPAVMLQQAYGEAAGLSLIGWTGEAARPLREVLGPSPQSAGGTRRAKPFAINLFVGPEGGFTWEEVEVARSYGIGPVSLGRRTLRAETAALVLAALVLHELGDLNP